MIMRCKQAPKNVSESPDNDNGCRARVWCGTVTLGPCGTTKHSINRPRSHFNGGMVRYSLGSGGMRRSPSPPAARTRDTDQPTADSDPQVLGLNESIGLHRSIGPALLNIFIDSNQPTPDSAPVHRSPSAGAQISTPTNNMDDWTDSVVRLHQRLDELPRANKGVAEALVPAREPPTKHQDQPLSARSNAWIDRSQSPPGVLVRRESDLDSLPRPAGAAPPQSHTPSETYQPPAAAPAPILPHAVVPMLFQCAISPLEPTRTQPQAITAVLDTVAPSVARAPCAGCQSLQEEIQTLSNLVVALRIQLRRSLDAMAGMEATAVSREATTTAATRAAAAREFQSCSEIDVLRVELQRTRVAIAVTQAEKESEVGALRSQMQQARDTAVGDTARGTTARGSETSGSTSALNGELGALRAELRQMREAVTVMQSSKEDELGTLRSQLHQALQTVTDQTNALNAQQMPPAEWLATSLKIRVAELEAENAALELASASALPANQESGEELRLASELRGKLQ